MRRSKLLPVLLALVITLQACAPAQLPIPQVITVVVTAVPSATEVATAAAASATPAPSPTAALPPTETLASTSTPSPQATDTLAPSPTFTQPVIRVNTPTRTLPPLPAVSNLPAQGPTGGDIDMGVVVSPVYLMRIKAKKHGSSNDGDGIDHVLFSVFDKKNLKVYSNNEKTAKYCIFQGGEPDCNPWPKSNGHYVWGSGGQEILSGNYQVTIRAALKSDPTNESEWTIQITIKIP